MTGDRFWTPARAPGPGLARECRVVVVENGCVTRFARGPARTADVAGSARMWMSGAVHDAEGRLVPESQRIWAGDRDAPVAADPGLIRVPRRARRFDGTWIYAGHWTRHFGHFLLETLTTLWPDPSHLAQPCVDGILAHRSCYGQAEPRPGDGAGTQPIDAPEWQVKLLELAGWGGLPLFSVRSRPVRVERLQVPSRSLMLKAWARPEATALWRRIASGVEPGADEAVFLSRRRFHRANVGDDKSVRAESAWDEELERRFSSAGFRVAHPEIMPLREQLALVGGARVLAGSAGSALHLSAFASPGTRVLEIGDRRTPGAPLPSQRMVDAACGHLSAFVPHADRRALRRALAHI